MEENFNSESYFLSSLKKFTININIASEETIKSWSHGEIKKPETINYRTLKPEKSGLFCAKIFGPIEDDQCLCGKYKRAKHRGIVCEKCGVEVTLSKVRRKRMAHITLNSPVVHVWFLKSPPSRLGLILNMTLNAVASVVYFEQNIVIDSEISDFPIGTIVNAEQTYELSLRYGNSIIISSGTEAILALLQKIDIEQEIKSIRNLLDKSKSEIKAKYLLKRLRLFENFARSGNKLTSLVLTVLPVISPELRPLVPLEGGRFASADLNDLYRRIINRNNRLKKLLDLGAPAIILRNEKRMLQEAVDALFDGGKSTKNSTITGPKRPLKSLKDNIKGKQGRFRQNLLGKRVDYSGRSIITAGPHLKFTECGLPKEMAVELFRPFIYAELQRLGISHTIKAAKKMVDAKDEAIWDILDDIISDYLVLLNRAPTLHKPGIQAFEPKLIEGKAIQLHPLVCTPFNADFDGDSMAVHIPLTIEAQLEARFLMLSSNNIFNPASGNSIINATQDIILGLYYASIQNNHVAGAGKIFSDYDAVKTAYENNTLHLHAPIKAKIRNVLENTTTGRVLLSVILPDKLPFKIINRVITKSVSSEIIHTCYSVMGQEDTVKLLDNMMSIGLSFATISGISIGIKDLPIPQEKKELVHTGYLKAQKIINQSKLGIISTTDRLNRILDTWNHVVKDLTSLVQQQIVYNPDSTSKINPMFLMLDSGARGSLTQMRQLSGMRGFMSTPTGAIIETPITSNFREGLDALQYFVSSHGARKGLADKALSTASAGYLTRRLVDATHDIVIQEYDCGTKNGIAIQAFIDKGVVLVSLKKRIVGKVLSVSLNLSDGTTIPANFLIDTTTAEIIEREEINIVHVRSAALCETSRGVCCLCYGQDLSRGKLVHIGEAIGIVAAQSVGEPGLQLAMRTFHTGGIASSTTEDADVIANYNGIITFYNLRTIKNSALFDIVISQNASFVIHDKKGQVLDTQKIYYGSQLYIQNDTEVTMGEIIASAYVNGTPIVAVVSGTVHYLNITDNPNIKFNIDTESGVQQYTVIHNHEENLQPALQIVDTSGRILDSYALSVGFTFYVANGSKIHAGTIIAFNPRQRKQQVTKDIVGGLPRIIELFEARRPKNAALLSEHTGIVRFGKKIRNKQCILLYDENNPENKIGEFIVPIKNLINIRDGEVITKGSVISDGVIDPNDILRIKGVKEVIAYIVRECQLMFIMHGASLHDKHFEVIIKAMLSKSKVVKSDSSQYLVGETYNTSSLLEYNLQRYNNNLPMIEYVNLLLGITKVSLGNESFLSAASFQETSKVLIEAAIQGQTDKLRGLKENILIGGLIPAGTGFPLILDSIKNMFEE